VTRDHDHRGSRRHRRRPRAGGEPRIRRAVRPTPPGLHARPARRCRGPPRVPPSRAGRRCRFTGARQRAGLPAERRWPPGPGEVAEPAHTREQGKPLRAARGEVDLAAGWVRAQPPALTLAPQPLVNRRGRGNRPAPGPPTAWSRPSAPSNFPIILSVCKFAPRAAGWQHRGAQARTRHTSVDPPWWARSCGSCFRRGTLNVIAGGASLGTALVRSADGRAGVVHRPRYPTGRLIAAQAAADFKASGTRTRRATIRRSSCPARR